MQADDRHPPQEYDADFVRDHVMIAPGRLMLAGIAVWLGCVTLMSCVGSVIHITAALRN